MFKPNDSMPIQRVSRTDPDSLLSSCSDHAINLDDADWPSAEHYYQGMKFDAGETREAVRSAADPNKARQIAKKHKRKTRKDWKQVRKTMMTRAMYIKCKAYPEVAQALLNTSDLNILETSQYDYYWGCGRDGLGDNEFGKLLMGIRDKLKEADN